MDKKNKAKIGELTLGTWFRLGKHHGKKSKINFRLVGFHRPYITASKIGCEACAEYSGENSPSDIKEIRFKCWLTVRPVEPQSIDEGPLKGGDDG